jgi:hypothetical protein
VGADRETDKVLFRDLIRPPSVNGFSRSLFWVYNQPGIFFLRRLHHILSYAGIRSDPGIPAGKKKVNRIPGNPEGHQKSS